MKRVKPPQFDFETSIALAHADDWMRYHSSLFSNDAMTQAETSRHRPKWVRALLCAAVARLRFWQAGEVSALIAPSKVRA